MLSISIDGGVKPTYHKRKIFYNRERSQRDTLCKRRKLADRSSIVTSDGGFSGESVSYSPEKGMNGDKSVPAGMLHRFSYLFTLSLCLYTF